MTGCMCWSNIHIKHVIQFNSSCFRINLNYIYEIPSMTKTIVINSNQITSRKNVTGRNKTKFSRNRRDQFTIKRNVQEYILDDKSAIYNGSESDDSDTDDENYNENNDWQQLPQGFANS